MRKEFGTGVCKVIVGYCGAIEFHGGKFYDYEKALGAAYDIERRQEPLTAENIRAAVRFAKETPPWDGYWGWFSPSFYNNNGGNIYATPDGREVLITLISQENSPRNPPSYKDDFQCVGPVTDWLRSSGKPSANQEKSKRIAPRRAAFKRSHFSHEEIDKWIKKFSQKNQKNQP